jgi:hypothetical protein
VGVDPEKVDTNIVIFEVAGVTSAELARRVEASGVRLHAIAPHAAARGHPPRRRRGRGSIARSPPSAPRWRGRKTTTMDARPEPSAGTDAEQLEKLGYAQELRRRMGAFSNFAISFSTICILAGGITSLQLGVSAVGGAAAGIVWPVGVVFSLIVALCMAQVASAFPTAAALTTGARSWAARAGAGRRPGSTWADWCSSPPRSTSAPTNCS